MMSKVRFCRYVVACFGVLIFAGGVVDITAQHPHNWHDALAMFGIAFMCLSIVREVDRGEGGWHQKVFAKKRTPPNDTPDGENT